MDLEQSMLTGTGVLCDTCRGLCENGAGWCWAPDSNGKQRPSFYLHHRRLSTLWAKAKAGCKLCFLFHSGSSLRRCKEQDDEDTCETEDEKRRVLSDAHHQDSDILQLLANGPQHPSHPEFGAGESRFQESDLERLRSIFGAERLIIKPQMLELRGQGNTLPAFLHVSCLNSPAAAASAAASLSWDASPIRVVVKHDDALKPFATPGGVLPEPDLLSETHIARISHWRQICSERHEGCPGDDEPRELPTRVIDVNTENIQHVKLVNTIRGSKAVYACLSYTWGDGAQYCTTKHNIKDHLERIYIRDLPRTVADAVRLCRALRIPYLWVDALCIVQDDKADWNREAAAMASIYGSATLTITSPSTTACSESFLVRDVGDHYQVSSDWVHAYSGTRGVVTLALSFRPPSPSRSPLYLTPWMQRGWTLQEWVLSPRLLQCGNTMTMFECLQGRCEEVIPDTPEGSFVALKWYDMVNQPPTLAEQNAETEPMDADEASRQSGSVRADGMSRMLKRCSRWRLDPTPRVSWAAIVEEFCGRGLTHSTDKLPALAGLATQFQAYKCATGPKQQSYDYFAGLWWCSNPMDGTPGDDAELPAGLLWRRSQMKRLASYRPPAVYRAPSWSWAAVDGYIRFLGPGTPKLQILHCVCEYEYPGTLSSVTTGWIDAEGLMRRTCVFESDRDIMLSTVVDGHFENEDDHVWHAFFDADDDYDDYDDRMARLGFEESKQLEIFLLLVATDEDIPGDPDSTHQALILKSVATEHGCQPDCFVRLGIATIHCQSEEGSEGLHEMFKDWDTKKVRLL